MFTLKLVQSLVGWQHQEETGKLGSQIVILTLGALIRTHLLITLPP